VTGEGFEAESLRAVPTAEVCQRKRGGEAGQKDEKLLEHGAPPFVGPTLGPRPNGRVMAGSRGANGSGVLRLRHRADGAVRIGLRR
jgi:hypothetical protein